MVGIYADPAFAKIDAGRSVHGQSASGRRIQCERAVSIISVYSGHSADTVIDLIVAKNRTEKLIAFLLDQHLDSIKTDIGTSRRRLIDGNRALVEIVTINNGV